MLSSPLAIAALFFGFSSSLHCAAMCGPLAAAVLPRRIGPLGAYAFTRTVAYTAGGCVAGALGELLARNVPPLLVPAIGIVGACFLLAQAAGISFPGPRGDALRRVLGRTLGWLQAGDALGRGAVLGVATALLPCGMLASVYALSAGTGSAQAGAVAAGAFAVGSTLGLLALPAALRLLVPAGSAQVVQRAGLCLAAGLLVVRAVTQARTGNCCP